GRVAGPFPRHAWTGVGDGVRPRADGAREQARRKKVSRERRRCKPGRPERRARTFVRGAAPPRRLPGRERGTATPTRGEYEDGTDGRNHVPGGLRRARRGGRAEGGPVRERGGGAAERVPGPPGGIQADRHMGPRPIPDPRRRRD